MWLFQVMSTKFILERGVCPISDMVSFRRQNKSIISPLHIYRTQQLPLWFIVFLRTRQPLHVNNGSVADEAQNDQNLNMTRPEALYIKITSRLDQSNVESYFFVCVLTFDLVFKEQNISLNNAVVITSLI